MDAAGGDDVPEPDERAPAAFPADPSNDAPGVPTLPHDGGTTRFLAALLTQSPFLDLHDRAAGDPAFRRRLCFGLDLIYRVLIYTLILAIVAGVAWKTLAPFR